MKYKTMRLLCMFDLPIDTKEEQRDYRKFRKKLLFEGFTMLQYSVYMRVCPNRDYAANIAKKISGEIPKSGNVRLLSVTEKQYQDMIFLVGNETVNEKKVGEQRLIIL